ncbi:MAG: hypothetical protein L6R39_002787 [Caloplaca ligustica]|nr:MAG: hypothetical protein L6R39_002787 [Caloplaca ligustica]
MEAIAVIGCIAAVVSAYRDGGAIVSKIKQRRLAKQAPPPPRLLEDSLAQGSKEVEAAKETGIGRFGPKYAAGDKLAVDALMIIQNELQASLIRHLVEALDDDEMTDFTTLTDASDIARIKTVTVLNALYMRVAMGNISAPVPFEHMGSFPSPPDPLDPQACTTIPQSHLITHPSNCRSEGDFVQQQPPPATEPLDLPKGPRAGPKLGLFDRLRQGSSTEKGIPKNFGRRLSNIPPEHKPATPENRLEVALTSSPMASPEATIDEDNPWAKESTKSVPLASDPTADKTLSQATTMGPSIGQRLSSASSASSTSNVRMLSPYELHGGFCKGAYKMQVHEKDVMKLRNQSIAKTGEGYYWACCSSKCAFEGPARQDGKKWAYDDTVRKSHGIRYRWSFLAKAHVTLPKVKDGKYDFGCVFCIYDGYECPVFHGIKEFLEHVGTHRGKAIAGTTLQRIRCINDRIATLDEDFDVNLAPLETKVHPVSDEDSSRFSHLGIMGAAATSDGVSWNPSDETMATVNPWSDAT